MATGRIGGGSQLERHFLEILKRAREWHPAVLLPNSVNDPLDINGAFPNPNQPLEAELGTGWGEVILRRALENPAINHLGFEIKRERLQPVFRAIDRSGIKNLRIVPINFQWYFRALFTRASLSGVYVYFPDPWPKRRHWKHRLITREFASDLVFVLKPGGFLEFATDYGPYARKVIRMFRATNGRFIGENGVFKPVIDGALNDYRLMRKPWCGSQFETRHLADGKKFYLMRYALSD